MAISACTVESYEYLWDWYRRPAAAVHFGRVWRAVSAIALSVSKLGVTRTNRTTCATAMTAVSATARSLRRAVTLRR